MNPLTLVKRIQKINSTEATLGISEMPRGMLSTRNQLMYLWAVSHLISRKETFLQYLLIVDVNLVRDKASGKSKGFAFLAYEDQRSTILAVDNLNGAKILGRIIRVDHVSNYKRKTEEDEAEKDKRDVCRAFPSGDCNGGSSCKFSHDEHRSANTGWGPKDESRWGHDWHSAGPSKGRTSQPANADDDDHKSRERY